MKSSAPRWSLLQVIICLSVFFRPGRAHDRKKRGGVFDVSHMGEFNVKGPQALDLIQRVTSNDAATLIDGQAQYSCLPNETAES
ncbi:MAG: hypothetical protein WDN75_12675 [Bacteroidota bacterium]